jgi:phosphoribosylformylglycinamidine synthase subunit PurL
LAEACRGLAEACREMETPVTGGNVSLYNETLDSNGSPQPIYPTPVIGMVGLVPNLSKVCGQGFQKVGDRIYLLGTPLDRAAPTVTLGASEYLAFIHETVAGRPPRVDFEMEKSVQAVCRHGIRAGWILSAHDCAEGGLAIALAESCITGRQGAQIEVPPPAPGQRWDELLFAEGGARIVISVDAAHQNDLENYLQENLGEFWQFLGFVAPASTGFLIANRDNLSLINARMEEISSAWSTAIEASLQAD